MLVQPWTCPWRERVPEYAHGRKQWPGVWHVTRGASAPTDNVRSRAGARMDISVRACARACARARACTAKPHLERVSSRRQACLSVIWCADLPPGSAGPHFGPGHEHPSKNGCVAIEHSGYRAAQKVLLKAARTHACGQSTSRDSRTGRSRALAPAVLGASDDASRTRTLKMLFVTNAT